MAVLRRLDAHRFQQSTADASALEPWCDEDELQRGPAATSRTDDPAFDLRDQSRVNPVQR